MRYILLYMSARWYYITMILIESFLLQVKCRLPTCNIRYGPVGGHLECRKHAACKEMTGQGYRVWNPSKCRLCMELWAKARDEDEDDEVKRLAQETLKKWVVGFAKNVGPGKPYVFSEEARLSLFPRADPGAAYHPPSEPESVLDLGVRSLTIDEKMEEGGRDQTPIQYSSFQTPVSSSSTRHQEQQEQLILPTDQELSDDGADESILEETPGGSKVKKINKKSKKEKRNKRDRKSPSKHRKRSSGSDSPDLKEAILGLTQQIDVLRKQVEQSRADGGPTGKKGIGYSLPDFAPSNPWLNACHMLIKEGMLCTMTNLGSRPLEDFEFCPKKSAFPNCHVRLREDPEFRDDHAPKETILHPYDQTQKFFVNLAKKNEFSNSGVAAHGGRKKSYLCSSEICFPFLEKAWEAAWGAARESKPMPTLEECKATSLLLPTSQGHWKEVEKSFEVGPLTADCACDQLDEKLPRLSATLIQREWDTRKRLSRSLSFQCSLETLMHSYPNEESYKVLSKSHLQGVLEDLYNFFIARKGCREHVLREAKVRHEPKRLIASPIWGSKLFDEATVADILLRASHENKSLLDKWGISSKASWKRKYSPHYGPQPKKSK